MDHCCDSDSSCEDIRPCGVVSIMAPPCPHGIHCIEPHCVYSHPYGRNNPLSLYQTFPSQFPATPNPYIPNVYPQQWLQTSYGPSTGIWPTYPKDPKAPGGSTNPPRLLYPQQAPSYPMPLTSTSSTTPAFNQKTTMPTPKFPLLVNNLSQTMQPNYVKMPELPKPSQQNIVRSSPASVLPAPYPIIDSMSMPQPGKPPTGSLFPNNYNAVQMPQQRPIPTAVKVAPPTAADIERARLEVTQLNLYQSQCQPGSLKTRPLPQMLTRTGSLSNKLNVPLSKSKPTAEKYESDESLCCICLENKPEIVLIPCGHAKFCAGCADLLKECPMCRSKIALKQKIFL